MNKKIIKPYTKAGDLGKTFLPGVGNVDKHHHMIEFIGTIDELTSMLGACISFLPDNAIELKKELIRTQKNVLSATAMIYSDKVKSEEGTLKNITLDLESSVDSWLEEIGAASFSFILPGGIHAAAFLHVARTICRRAERRLSCFCEINGLQGYEDLFAFLNRLSDYLFVMARYVNYINNSNEENWSFDRLSAD